MKSQKRTGKLGLLGPTEVQINSGVSVFRESQQRNYMLLQKPEQFDVFSVTPLPKVIGRVGPRKGFTPMATALIKSNQGNRAPVSIVTTW